MRAVLSWAIEHGEGELALRVGAQRYDGSGTWKDITSEGRRWLEAALGKDWARWQRRRGPGLLRGWAGWRRVKVTLIGRKRLPMKG